MGTSLPVRSSDLRITESPYGSATGATPAVRDYLRILKRRAWVVVLAAYMVPAAAGALSAIQAPRYEASSEVLLRHSDLATGLTGIADPSIQQPDRVVATQAGLARVPALARRVIQAAHARDLTTQRFLADSSVEAKPNTDILLFTVDASTRARAMRLASAYARQYAAYRRELDTAPIRGARDDIKQRIQQLTSSGKADHALLATLKADDQKLWAITALQTSNATVVRSGGFAVQTQPRTKRNVILGLGLGLALGVGLAFLFESFDTRVREVDEIAERLALPLLATLPRRPLRTSQRALARRADSAEAETFRLLRRRVELALLDEQTHVVMVTSALPSEGRSVTAANLALAFAWAGRHVVLVDADLRTPVLDQLLHTRSEPGLTDVALGCATLEEALVAIHLSEPRGPAPAGAAKAGGHHPVGTLEVLPAGSPPAQPGEFLETSAFQQQLRELTGRADVVLLDSPALLQVDDGIALSASVDAVIVVVHADVARRPRLAELRRALEACRAEQLGVVVNCVSGPARVGARPDVRNLARLAWSAVLHATRTATVALKAATDRKRRSTRGNGKPKPPAPVTKPAATRRKPATTRPTRKRAARARTTRR
jgi:succinoglycan biosynthesis transport protein ExoP